MLKETELAWTWGEGTNTYVYVRPLVQMRSIFFAIILLDSIGIEYITLSVDRNFISLALTARRGSVILALLSLPSWQFLWAGFYKNGSYAGWRVAYA